MATEPTSKAAATQAASSARTNLDKARGSANEVGRVVGSLERMLEENHFSQRIARALGLEDDRT